MSASGLIQTDCVIDYEELLTRCMGNQPFAARILRAFREQLATDLAELQNAIASGDDAKVAVIAHRVKGSSSNVSARRLNELATTIGEFANRGQSDQLRLCQPAIHEEEQRFVESSQQLDLVTTS